MSLADRLAEGLDVRQAWIENAVGSPVAEQCVVRGRPDWQNEVGFDQFFREINRFTFGCCRQVAATVFCERVVDFPGNCLLNRNRQQRSRIERRFCADRDRLKDRQVGWIDVATFEVRPDSGDDLGSAGSVAVQCDDDFVVRNQCLIKSRKIDRRSQSLTDGGSNIGSWSRPRSENGNAISVNFGGEFASETVPKTDWDKLLKSHEVGSGENIVRVKIERRWPHAWQRRRILTVECVSTHHSVM